MLEKQWVKVMLIRSLGLSTSTDRHTHTDFPGFEIIAVIQTVLNRYIASATNSPLHWVSPESNLHGAGPLVH